jgi:signal transduction histidine kinase
MKLQGRGYQMKSIDDRALANNRHGYPHQELMRPRMATFHPDESNRRFTERSQVIANQTLEKLLGEKMEALSETEEQSNGKDRLAVIGEFAAMIVHEIRSPLSTIGMTLEYLKEAGQSEKAEKRIRLVESENRRLKTLLNELLAFAKPQPLLFSRIDLGLLVQEIIIGMASDRLQQRKVNYQPPENPVFVFGNSDKLKQVVINLLSNACQAVGCSEEVDVICYAADKEKKVVVEVRNQGNIAVNVLSRITEPFMTTKPSGTGLGLAIVKRLVDTHMGELEIELNTPEEVCVRVSLPQSK